MSTLNKVLVALALIAATVGLGSVVWVGGTFNEFVSAENGIKAQYSENQNNYDNMWKKFKEAAQVNAMYASDLQKVFTSAIQGRYGKDGSKAVFQFLKEHNPNLDVTTYRQLQAMVESGRNSFEYNQKTLIDKKQVYETQLQTFPNVFVAQVLGFPRIDLAKYDIVTSDVTATAFESKKANEIKLRDN